MIKSLKRFDVFFWILLAGILLRLAVYFSSNSFWYDEVLYMSELLSRDWGDLTRPILNSEVVCPLGFMWAVKACSVLWGKSEFVLRLPLLISGLLSLFVFKDVAVKLLKQRAALWAVGFFALSYYAVQYTAQCKHYAMDILFSLLLLKGFLCFQEKNDGVFQRITLLLTGMFSVWFSFSAVFLIFTYGLFFFYKAWKEKDIRRILNFVLLGASCALSFVVYYLYFLKSAKGSGTYLYQSWIDSGGFPDFSKLSFELVLWPFKAALDFFEHPVGIPSAFGLILFAAGFFFLKKRNSKNALLLGLPFLLNFALSILQIYPFQHRTVVYLMPLAVLLAAEGFSEIYLYIKKYSRFAALVLIVLFVFKNIELFNKEPVMLKDYSKFAIEYLTQQVKEQDRIITGRYSHPQFRFYTMDKQIPFGIVSGGHPWALSGKIAGWSKQEYGLKRYLKDLNRIALCNERVWIFVTDNDMREKEIIYSYLSAYGEVKLVYSNHNAHVLVYERH